MFDQKEVEKLFGELQKKLARQKLPVAHGSARFAAADEFMLMDIDENYFAHFKHRASRNYVYFELITWNLQLGDGKTAFNHHDFPAC